MTGVFFLVVGPSGAGKDTLIDGARRAEPDLVIARRVITRPAGSPGEDHEALDEAAFVRQAEQGAFLITWGAHDLRYGLRRELLDHLAQGRHVLANGSRAVIGELAGKVPHLVVVEVAAPPEVLRERILSRGRESAEQAGKRLKRRAEVGDSACVLRVMNDGTPAAGVSRFLAALRGAMAPAAGRAAIDAKLSGMSLSEDQYAAVIDDIVAGRLDGATIDAFLMHAVAHLDDAEVLALAKARARVMPRIDWDEPIVVDKHSLGGIPGSRITLIVAPIVAAHGLAMPKTSSRAITSAAGTADAMQTVAKVDLDPRDVRRCVAQARACIAWNGRLNHSLIDDRINARTLALNLQSNRWSVASILSKKYSAGSTHIVVDLPCGPRAKLRTRAEAQAMQRLFEQAGAGMGLRVKALITDGTRPIGAGIGPALEARDVRRVLGGDPDAPADLREKALLVASHILAWAPDVGSVQAGRERAQELLAGGAALAAFERIIDAQGRAEPPVVPGRFSYDICAGKAGTVGQVDGWRITAIAREAGAPQDLSAGVDLLCRPGKRVAAGEPLYRIHADAQAALDAAVRVALQQSGITLQE